MQMQTRLNLGNVVVVAINQSIKVWVVSSIKAILFLSHSTQGISYSTFIET